MWLSMASMQWLSISWLAEGSVSKCENERQSIESEEERNNVSENRKWRAAIIIIAKLAAYENQYRKRNHRKHQWPAKWHRYQLMASAQHQHGAKR
jgi:hypothetical protein